MDRKSITVVVLVLLCAAGFAYSQGWFDWSRSATEIESNKVSATETLDQDNVKTDVVQVAEKTIRPTSQAAE